MPVAATTPSPLRYEEAADPAADTRARAAAELAPDPRSAAATTLVTLAEHDPDPHVRTAAVRAIAERRDPSLLSVIDWSAAYDPDRDVREASSRSDARLWPWAKSPHVALGLSLLCPGCGQIYLRQYAEGAALLATSLGFLIAGAELTSGHDTTLSGPYDTARVPIGLVLGEWGQDEWFYSIFDAYRTARVLRGDFGYRHSITRETLPELASAPFRPSVLESPWVWAGVPISLGAGLLAEYVADGRWPSGPSIFNVPSVNFLGHTLSPRGGYAAGNFYYAALFDPVGVGEESLFRGLIQTELDERFGTYGGLALASSLFAAAHLLNFAQDSHDALYAVPTIALLGSSLGLAYIHTGYRLETSVAMHFWYDFLLSAVDFAMDPQHQPFVVQYSARL